MVKPCEDLQGFVKYDIIICDMNLISVMALFPVGQSIIMLHTLCHDILNEQKECYHMDALIVVLINTGSRLWPIMLRVLCPRNS